VIAGYYTLASGSIPIAELPPELARRLPRYPTLPAVRIGRLAVDARFRGQGFGRLRQGDEATRHAPADVLRDLLVKVAVEFGDAARKGAAVVSAERLKATLPVHEPCTSRR